MNIRSYLLMPVLVMIAIGCSDPAPKETSTDPTPQQPSQAELKPKEPPKVDEAALAKQKAELLETLKGSWQSSQEDINLYFEVDGNVKVERGGKTEVGAFTPVSMGQFLVYSPDGTGALDFKGEVAGDVISLTYDKGTKQVSLQKME